MDSWIRWAEKLCQPDRVVLCDGSEVPFLERELVSQGKLIPLKRPRSFWCHSSPDDVARVEADTYICTENKEDAGPMNQWVDPTQMKEKMIPLFRGTMRGKTMYVFPYFLGPEGSSFGRYGVEITDSPYVVLNLHKMTRLVRNWPKQYVKGLHATGGLESDRWPSDSSRRTIAHFPESLEIWSYGSGYGGNALLPKKSFALRLASWMGRSEGWLAEHMLLMGVTNPQGKKRYIAAAFPSACGKTNLAMMQPRLPGWKVECVGDDIAWLHQGSDGRLYGINPEAGFFGVAPGTSMSSNPNGMRTIEKNALFTNTALTPDHDVWWEGMGVPPPEGLISWRGKVWDGKETAAHPNSRFTVSIKECPILDPEAENIQGVPLSAILFGTRRTDVQPLVREAKSWEQGVFFGASLLSETTAAAVGEVGKLRHDPFAMRPFCGYHMGDYFAHWLKMKPRNPPKIFAVNWFLKGADGAYLWPGFGDNIRVIEWIFDRCETRGDAVESPIGWLPTRFDQSLVPFDAMKWKKEMAVLSDAFAPFGKRMPKELLNELASTFSAL